MISIQHEQLVTLTEAARRLPGRSTRPSVSTIFRWVSPGLRGIQFETVKVGGRRCTSIEALERFFQRLTDLPEENCHSHVLPSSGSARQRQTQHALERAGIAESGGNRGGRPASAAPLDTGSGNATSPGADR